MSSFGFCFRASTRKGEHPGKIYLRVVHGCSSRSITTDYRVFPEEWNHDERRLNVVGSRERKLQLAECQESMNEDAARLEGVIRNLEHQGAFTIDDIMARYRNATAGNSVNVYVEKLAIVMEQNGYERTARAYRSAATSIGKFNGDDVKLEQLNSSLVNEFQMALEADGKSMNTISFYMRTLRAIYNKAIADGRVTKQPDDPFSGVYTGISPTKKLALTAQELGRLSEFNPATGDKDNELPGHLKAALAMFLFSYHSCGMCFVDMAFLKKTDIRSGVIRYRLRKTGQVIEVRVLPVMRRILDWFAPQVVGSDYLFPIIADGESSPRLQYESGLRIYNDRLKGIAQFLGIEKQLSSHCARHSWEALAGKEWMPRFESRKQQPSYKFEPKIYGPPVSSHRGYELTV